ncbi:MAG TPA: branched-chain amino acid ABC transporter substrate-binding protein [Candidatus Acidoferrales bacterium]|nr:branched-chain amino acid ABC transporter substrate-binding protein [Candidatus Acidoferrales bacterium]
MTSRRAFLGGAATLAAAAAASPASAQLAPLASIAVMGPETGGQAELGKQLVNGVRGCFDDVNGLRTTASTRFWAVRPFDDQNTLANALLVSRFAIDDQTQTGAIGHLSGKITSQVLRYYADANMPLIVPAATTDSITAQGYRNVFRLTTKDSVEGTLHAKFVAAEKRGKKVAVVYLDGDYGPDVAGTFLKQTSGDGLNPVDVRLSNDHPDIEGAATTIVQSQADLVFFAGLAPELGRLIPALRNAGWNGQFDGSAAFFDAGLWPSYGKQIDGLIVSTSMPPLQIVPAALAIKSQYEGTYGPMTPIAAFAYSAAQIFVTAVQRFSSTSRVIVARAIAQSIPLQTLVGTFTFDAFGDPMDPNVYFYRLEGGNWHYVRAAHPSSYIVR